MGKKSCIAMWNDLLNGRSGRFYEGVIERTIEANYPGPTPSVEGSSSDSSSCPPLHDTSPEPSCPSLYDTSPEPCREGSVIELSSDGSEGRPERSRKRSIIVIDSDSSEDSPRSRKRMHLEEESCQSPVPESGGSNNSVSHQRVESEGVVAAPANVPAQATSTDDVNHEMEEGPKHMVRTLWKSILDSNFPEEAVHHQITGHYIRTEGYIIGDGNCMFRAIAFALYGDQEKHRD
ncbi:OTU-domain-containing protein, partial [Wallemia mellicola]